MDTTLFGRSGKQGDLAEAWFRTRRLESEMGRLNVPVVRRDAKTRDV